MTSASVLGGILNIKQIVYTGTSRNIGKARGILLLTNAGSGGCCVWIVSKTNNPTRVDNSGWGIFTVTRESDNTILITNNDLTTYESRATLIGYID